MIIFFVDFAIVGFVFIFLFLLAMAGVESLSAWIVQHAWLFIGVISVILIGKILIILSEVKTSFSAKVKMFMCDWMRLAPVLFFIYSYLEELSMGHGVFDFIVIIVELIISGFIVLLIWGLIEALCLLFVPDGEDEGFWYFLISVIFMVITFSILRWMGIDIYNYL